MRKRMRTSLSILLAMMGIVGCQTYHEVAVKPVEVKPIHITIDVNVRIDRALDDFFGDIDDTRQEIQQQTEKKQ